MFVDGVQILYSFYFYFGMLYLLVTEIGMLKFPTILGIYPFLFSVLFVCLFGAHVVIRV